LLRAVQAIELAYQFDTLLRCVGPDPAVVAV